MESNPFEELVQQTLRAFPVEPMCTACRNFGYLLPEKIAQACPEVIPAWLLFAEGIPCACENGNIFREHQCQWNMDGDAD